MTAENNEAVLDIMEEDRQTGDIEGFKLELYRLEPPLLENQSKRAQTLGRDPTIWKSVFLDTARADQMKDRDPEGSSRQLLQSIAGARLLGMLDPEKAPVLYQRFEDYAQRAGVSLTETPDSSGAVTISRGSQLAEAPPVSLPSAPARLISELLTPEERAERIVRNITYAEFSSFQEYLYAAERSGNQFDLNSTPSSKDTDVIPMYKIDDRTTSVIYRFMQYFHIPIRGPSSERIPYGSLFCVIGKKDGQFIVQGAGTIHRDLARRQNDSSFKIVFSSDTEFNDFINWLKDSPSDALSLTVENLVQNSRQKPSAPDSGVGLQNVYSRQRWIGKLTVKNVDTQEIVVKDFEEPLLHQERIDMVKNIIRSHGSIQQARDVYQKRAEDPTDRQAQEAAKWMLSMMDAYEAQQPETARMPATDARPADRTTIKPPEEPILPNPYAGLTPAKIAIPSLNDLSPEEIARITGIPFPKAPTKPAPPPPPEPAPAAETVIRPVGEEEQSHSERIAQVIEKIRADGIEYIQPQNQQSGRRLRIPNPFQRKPPPPTDQLEESPAETQNRESTKKERQEEILDIAQELVSGGKSQDEALNEAVAEYQRRHA